MSGDLISRSAVCAKCGAKEAGELFSCSDECLIFPGNVPSVDAVPVVHGRWILQGFEDCMTRCSVCNVRAPRNDHGDIILSTFCWECGVKMDGGENS